MHPVLSIGIYGFMQLLVFLLSLWCLRNNPVFRIPARVLHPAGILAGLCFFLFSLLPVAGAMLPECPLKYELQGMGNIWLGFTVYYNGILILLCAAAFPAKRIAVLRQRGGLHSYGGKEMASVRWERNNNSGKIRAGIFLISLLGSIGILVYGMIHAQNTIVTRWDVSVEKSAGDHSDLKIILIGDLHLSVNSHLSTIEKIVNRINREQPDVVLIAGDIFTSSYRGLKNPDRYAEVLSRLETKYGVYAVYGNHDVEETLFGGFPISPISQAFRTREMEQFFKDCKFHVLYDEMVSIAGDSIQIVGRVDGEKAGDGTALRKTPAQVLSGIDPEKPVIVLQHEPVEFAALKESGADLALCGHTHAGQIFPGNCIVPFFNENAYGWKKAGGLDTFVTSGIGYYGPPMRVGTNSEIMVINVHFL